MNATGTAFASADDYAFELVRGQIRSSNIATIAVRLVKKSTGKPVPDAMIVQTLLDMAPDEMADMATTAIVPLPSPEPGVYAFKAPLTMVGHWRLTISAKVRATPNRWSENSPLK